MLRGEGELGVFIAYLPSPRSGEAAELERGPGGEVRIASKFLANTLYGQFFVKPSQSLKQA
jgi:hypothetical protein